MEDDEDFDGFDFFEDVDLDVAEFAEDSAEMKLRQDAIDRALQDMQAMRDYHR